LAAYWRYGGFEPAQGLRNCEESSPAEIPPETASSPQAAPPRQALSARVRIGAFGILAIGLLALMVPTQRFGDSPTYKISEQQATAAAEAFLRGQGLDPAAFQHVTFPATHW